MAQDNCKYEISTYEPPVLMWPEQNCNGTPIQLQNPDGRGVHQDNYDFVTSGKSSDISLLYFRKLIPPTIDGLLGTKSVYVPPHLELDWTSNINLAMDVRNDPATTGECTVKDGRCLPYNNQGTLKSGFTKNMAAQAGVSVPWAQNQAPPTPIDNSWIHAGVGGQGGVFATSKADCTTNPNDWACAIRKVCCDPNVDPAISRTCDRLFSNKLCDAMNVPATITWPTQKIWYNRPRSVRIRQLDTWDNFKVDCCRSTAKSGMSTQQRAEQCGIFWGPNRSGDCDQTMQDWCYWNPDHPDCACVNSDISNPQCWDPKCVGNLTAYRTSTQARIALSNCPKKDICTQSISIGDQARNNILNDITLAQKCDVPMTSTVVCTDFIRMDADKRSALRNYDYLSRLCLKSGNDNDDKPLEEVVIGPVNEHGEVDISTGGVTVHENNPETKQDPIDEKTGLPVGFPPLNDPRWHVLSIPEDIGGVDKSSTKSIVYLLILVFILYMLSTISIFGTAEPQEYLNY